jgi:putative transposase
MFNRCFRRRGGVDPREAGVMPSMGSVGDAYDNAMAESFFATLERELLIRRRFKSQAQAKMAVFEWIAGVQPASTALLPRIPIAGQLRACTSAIRRRNPELLPPAAAGSGWGVRLMETR